MNVVVLIYTSGYNVVSKNFRTELMKKYTLIFGITRCWPLERVIAVRVTRLTHKIAIQLHLMAESCTICSSRSRRSVRKLLDTPPIFSSTILTSTRLERVTVGNDLMGSTHKAQFPFYSRYNNDSDGNGTSYQSCRLQCRSGILHRDLPNVLTRGEEQGSQAGKPSLDPSVFEPETLPYSWPLAR
jgi:hypothetical protein